MGVIQHHGPVSERGGRCQGSPLRAAFQLEADQWRRGEGGGTGPLHTHLFRHTWLQVTLFSLFTVTLNSLVTGYIVAEATVCLKSAKSAALLIPCECLVAVTDTFLLTLFSHFTNLRSNKQRQLYVSNETSSPSNYGKDLSYLSLPYLLYSH